LALGSFAVAIVGIFIALGSDNPVISLFGYGLVVISEGLLLGPVLALYTQASIAKVFLVTSGMVTVLGAAGIIYPKSLASWGGWLFGGLLLLILGLLIVPIAAAFGVNVGGALTVLDWVGIVLFGAYVIYDLNRAMDLERTLDNTVDVALAVYLDFINIFIRLLRLYGEKK
ncbi:MAG: Bax inhibitor-1 family protein, partial [Patescibacteria group bacterium]